MDYEQVKMDYEQFEKRVSPDKLRSDIINLLHDNPMLRKEIRQELGVTESKFAQQWKHLKKQGIGLKKFFHGNWWYGLSKDYRLKKEYT